jgi:multidrug efflux pump subunit AcrA (membrane-fusion protein)
MKKSIGIIIVLVLSITGAGLFFLVPESVNPQREARLRLEEQTAKVPVRIAEASTETLEDYIRLSGDIEAESTVQVYPDVTGTLTSFRVRVGDYVQKNETLALVDPNRPGASYSISPVEAPIRGTVTEILLDPGDTVSASVPILKLGDLNSLLISARVSERYVNRVRRGQTAFIRTEAMPDRIFEARVSEVYPVLDPASRSMKIKLTFSDLPEGIKAGMLAEITLITSRIDTAVTIPSAALVSRGDETFVYVVEGSTAARRRVITGLVIDGTAEITEGLKAGEAVVTSGMNMLSDGSTVQVIGNRGEKDA